ncbi:hypothetical protein BJY00DRAFT_224115 [Aspergillus carlsbadensis]|nr:hypothetical protein BJY00DRAFT_224115 [Aspergillus carlsbadensis]
MKLKRKKKSSESKSLAKEPLPRETTTSELRGEEKSPGRAEFRMSQHSFVPALSGTFGAAISRSNSSSVIITGLLYSLFLSIHSLDKLT